MRAPAAVVLALLVVLPAGVALDAAAASPTQPWLALSFVDQAVAKAARGDWHLAVDDVASARNMTPTLVIPATPPGSGVNATLDALGAALRARDLGATRVSAAGARAAFGHAGLLGDPMVLLAAASPLSFDQGLLPGQDPLTADQARQRNVALAAEKARLATRLWLLAWQEGLPGEVQVWEAAARGWTDALAGESQRFPNETRADFDHAREGLRNATTSASGAAKVEAQLRPLLLGLGLGRTLTRLDDLGDGVLTSALAAHAAVLEQRQAPTHSTVALRDAAVRDLETRYREVRGGIFLGGEGDVGPLDANVTLLRQQLLAGASEQALAATVADLRRDLARITHLTFGAFVKAQFVHVRPTRPIEQDVQAGRFPFEGVASWNLTLRFDPSLAKVGRVDRVAFQLDVADWDNAEGRVTLRGSAATPVLRDGVLARLHWVAAGAPLQETNVTFDDVELRDPQGNRVELFLVAPGRVIVAQVDPVAPDTPEEDPLALTNPELKRKSPGAGAGLLALAVAALAVVAGRRR